MVEAWYIRLQSCFHLHHGVAVVVWKIRYSHYIISSIGINKIGIVLGIKQICIFFKIKKQKFGLGPHLECVWCLLLLLTRGGCPVISGGG